ncbi:MAG: efflux RND transporter permease subunit [Gammaproteobacteria bacterium]|nr:efflux RND transporter permease subunit [Gammaproteobacteria bacterium]MCW8986678.1 efflux RND transporter permease subunit [Gammaproteobacteria bacterium]MCW9031545.1 efflux RND transporter permease subunit [Gammaproteobacteria bacterium]
MNSLINFFLQRSMLVKLIFISVFAFGLSKMLTIQKEGFPSVNLNMVTVSTIYRGASAEDVELNITTKLEEEIREVNGLYEVTSTSRENVSAIVIQADEDATTRELTNIVTDIKQAVDQTRDLPLDLDELPVVDVVSTSDRPIISVNLFGDHEKLREILPVYERGIESLQGVAGVDKIGYFDREIHIEINPNKAKDLRISLSEVLFAIQSRNLRTTGGTLESYLNEQTVISLNKFNNPAEVENVILRANISGQIVRIKDIASVTLREKDENFIVRNEGKPGMNLVIRKKENADIIKTLDRVKEYMANQPKLEGIGYSYSNDQSARTRLRLQVLGGNALLGFVLVTFILMLALNRQAAFWTAMSVPFSLFGLFILLPYFGITINGISLAGFVLVLGLLVDDAIVVAEKITHYEEKGLSAKDAALKGVTAMWRPVTVASLTTILAFSPMFSIGGMPGKFAWAIPAVVIIALLVSLFESFFILPHHLSSPIIKRASNKKAKGKADWIIKLEARYGNLLEGLLHRRYIVLTVMILILLSSVFLVKTSIKFQIFPQDGVETFYIKLEMQRGASLEATETRLKELEEYIKRIPEHELESYATRVGTLSTDPSKNRGDHSHWGVISVFLTGEARRERSADDIIASLRQSIPAAKNEVLLFDKQRVGPAIGKPAEIRISSNDDKLRQKTAKEIIAFMKTLPGVLDVETDNKPGKDQLIVNIDYKKLAEVGLKVKDVSDALRVTYDGMLVSSTTNVDETIEYRVIVDPKYRNSEDMLFKIPVKNDRGQVLNLSDVLSLSHGRGPLEFQHVNGIRTETISADLNPALISPPVIQKKVTEHFKESWAQQTKLNVAFAGEAREQKKIFGGFLTAGIVALVSIYLVVALLLNSFGQSFIVMSVIPFAIIGVIWSFYAHGMPLSFFSTMGTLGLIGVVVNDTIIMVTEVNRELALKHNANLVRTVVYAAKDRLRPVLLTTFTTVAGLLPTAYGIGGKDGLIMPLTMAMAYGLLFATLITLILTPALLIIGHDIAYIRGRGSNHQRGRSHL